MYRERSSDPLALYWEARLLMWHEPLRAKWVFENLLHTNPNFAWPHLDISDWRILPGRRDDPELVSHGNEFQKACPEAFAVPMVVNPDTTRRALQRRNTPLELQTWLALWIAEENTGTTSKELPTCLRADLKRMEAWPFRADPELFRVYREAARILKDPGVVSSLRVKVEHDAPDSLLAMSFV